MTKAQQPTTQKLAAWAGAVAAVATLLGALMTFVLLPIIRSEVRDMIDSAFERAPQSAASQADIDELRQVLLQHVASKDALEAILKSLEDIQARLRALEARK